MTDLTKLKELAELATPGPWSAVWEEGDETAWPNLFPIIQADNGEVVIGNEGFYTDLEQDKANATFCAAANPQAILGLIAEVEKLRADTSSMRGSLNAYSKSTKKLVKDGTRAAKERDRLKAENDALRKQLEQVHPFKFAGPIEGPDLKCAACGGYHYGLPAGMPCPKSAAVAYDAAMEGGGR